MMSGKKPIAAHAWERDENDWYVEPERVTTQLLQRETIVGSIYDPCCGQGNIINACILEGRYDVAGADLVQRTQASWFIGTRDYRDMTHVQVQVDNIITNPPFSLLPLVVEKACREARNKVCIFAEARFLFGEKRAKELHAVYRPVRVYIITPRPSCPPGAALQAGAEPVGGRQDYVWLVYDARANGQAAFTEMEWLT